MTETHSDWRNASDVLTSSVAHLKTTFKNFDWVGIYLLNGDVLELGPFIGAATDHTTIKVGVGVCGTAVARNEDMNVPDVTQLTNYLSCSVETASELVVLIRDANGKVLGQIDIDSHTRNAFGPEEERAVREVADELGRLWPANAGARW